MGTQVNLNNIIIELDNKLINLLPEISSLGLFSGKMGICIYFFYKSRLLNNKEYRVIAENLLDEIYFSIKKVPSINFDNGLSGIAWGINYLLKNEFVKGSPDVILEEIDDCIFHIANFSWLQDKKSKLDYILILFYLSERISASKQKTHKVILQNLTIDIINHLEHGLFDDEWRQPFEFDLLYTLPLYLLALERIYKLDFYNYKIVKIWDGLSDTVLSTIPLKQLNRFYLLIGIESVLKHIDFPEWRKHATLLQENVNIQDILNVELLNKMVNMRNGVTGYALLLTLLSEDKTIQDLDLKKRLMKKIETSEVWRDKSDPSSENFINKLGLFNGYIGTALVYQLLNATI